VAIVWDADRLEELRRIEFGSANDQFGQNPRHSGVHRLAVSHDSRWLAVAGGEKLNVHDLASGVAVGTEGVTMDAAFHPAARLLVAGESEAKVWAYDAHGFASLPPDKDGRAKPPGAIAGRVLATIRRGDWSLGLRFSPDGKQLALGRGDGSVELWTVS
jgi:WD40 repeat protein